MSPKDDNDSHHNSAATPMTQQSHQIPQQPPSQQTNQIPQQQHQQHQQQSQSQPQSHPQPHEEEDVTSQRSHYSHQSFQSADDSSATPGGCFFADMTLDLREAHLEATPRTDRRYATLATEGILMEGEEELGGGRMISPLPLLGGDARMAGEKDHLEGYNNGVKHKHNEIETETEHEHENDATTSAMESTTLTTDPRDNSKTTSPLEMEDRTFARITGGAEGGGSVHSSSSHGFRSHDASRLAPPRPPRPPRRPRDVSWTAAASLILPLGLIVPHFYYSAGYVARHNRLCDDDDDDAQNLPGCTVLHPSWVSTAHYSASHHTIFLSSLLSTLLSILLLRRLYSSPGGGDGDDARHAIVTRTFLLSSHASVAIHPLLAGAIGYWLPDARHAALVPLALFARDVYRARSAGGGNGSALPAFRGGGGTGASSSATSSHDRQTFFRALACAALDILSRSLRRKSFVRAATALMILQFLCVTSWWSAVRAVLAAKVFVADGVVARWVHGAWLTLALLAGKWATGTIARVLGYVASGGVASWFAQQTWMIEERTEKERAEAEALERQKKTETPSGTNDYDSSAAAAKAARHAMPEAYRAADASAYAPVMDFDDGLDDDYDDDGDFDHRDALATTAADAYSWGGGGPSPSAGQTNHSAVKTFLAAAATTGFGSVAQCGLLGGLAQFLWSVVRNADAMRFFLAGRLARNSSGFRGMDVSVDASASGSFSSPRQWRLKIAFYWRKLDAAIRGFVRSHSDLAMSHVAAYYKSYQRAANDVAALIEASGVEPIIHDDITTHMCSSVCTLVSGTIVLLFGMLLTTHRNITNAGSAAENYLTDVSLLEVLLFTYILCYTLVFTALEPLRAAIKAVYVCFAEHPMSLSQAFPLIYQRLSRISGASGPIV